jgi:uncharacterized protein
MRTAISAFVLCLIAVVAQGQDGRNPRIVKTTGIAELKVTPDLAVIQLGVERQSVSARTAKAAVASASRKILAELNGLGIEEKDVQTAYLSLQPMIDYRKGLRITNFTAEQSLSVTVRDLSKIDTVMDSVISAGANQIEGIEYGSSGLRRYKDEARDEAAHAAREKADALARALGGQIGKTYSVEEIQQTDEYYGPIAGVPPNVFLADKRSRAPSTAPGELTVRASIVVSFDLL